MEELRALWQPRAFTAGADTTDAAAADAPVPATPDWPRMAAAHQALADKVLARDPAALQSLRDHIGTTATRRSCARSWTTTTNA